MENGYFVQWITKTNWPVDMSGMIATVAIMEMRLVDHSTPHSSILLSSVKRIRSFCLFQFSCSNNCVWQ